MDYSQLLPPEIFYLIISYLDGDEIFPCLGVCRKWRNLLNHDEFWKKLCVKARIFDPSSTIQGPLPLCPWAQAYFRFRCIPYFNWRHGPTKFLHLSREESEHYTDAWDGHYAAIYYYTFAKLNIYTIYEKITLNQTINIPLPKTEVFNNSSVSINDPYIVVSRFNVAIILSKNSNTYSILRHVSIVNNNFEFSFKLSKRNCKMGTEIAWGCLWMKCDPVPNTWVVDLKDFSTKILIGKPHLAFNDHVKLVIAWTKSNVRIASLKGDILLTLERNKIRSIDFNNNYLILKIENDIEILNIKNGNTLYTLKTTEKVEFGLCNNLLILLEGQKMCKLMAISLINFSQIWSVTGLIGRACDLRFIGSKFIFTVPSFKKNCYCLIDFKGNFIRECVLPDVFDLFPSPLFGETLPFVGMTNELDFDIMSFI